MYFEVCEKNGDINIVINITFLSVFNLKTDNMKALYHNLL